MLGGISLTNTGAEECLLVGYLRITLLDQQGRTLSVEVQHGPPVGEVNPSAAPAPVELPPGQGTSASVSLQWLNWCGQNPGTVSVRAVLSSGQTLQPVVMGTAGGPGVARCDETSSTSSLVEGPLQAVNAVLGAHQFAHPPDGLQLWLLVDSVNYRRNVAAVVDESKRSV